MVVSLWTLIPAPESAAVAADSGAGISAATVGMLRKKQINTFDNAAARIAEIIKNRRVTTHNDGTRLLFLCGGNKDQDTPSERRLAITNFINHHFSDVYVIYAEKIYNELLKTDKSYNLYDLETDISQISDFILIVLEGEGSFCELGAFSHSDLRDKVYVINDLKHSKSQSFVNLGPISILERKSSVFYYPMNHDGRANLDRIGDTFPRLHETLKSKSNSKTTKFDEQKLAPSQKITKHKTLFLHDLIFFCGKTSYKDLISLIQKIFGPDDYRLPKKIIAILIGLQLIKRDDNGNFYSRNEKTFFSFDNDEDRLSISLRLSITRSNFRKKI